MHFFVLLWCGLFLLCCGCTSKSFWCHGCAKKGKHHIYHKGHNTESEFDSSPNASRIGIGVWIAKGEGPCQPPPRDPNEGRGCNGPPPPDTYKIN